MASTFSDETTSGRWLEVLRGSRRVTILARAEDDQAFDWLARFKKEFLPTGAEAKSSNVLPVLDLHPRARKLVLREIEGCSIFVVDIHECGRHFLREIVARLRPLIPPGLDPYEFVLQLPHIGSKVREFLRQMVISHSVVGRIESLLEWASNPFADELRGAGLDLFAHTQAVHVVSRPELEDMDDGQLAILLARLGAAIGDALSPEWQAKTIFSLFEHVRYFAGGYFAYRTLSVELGTDRIYDVGPMPVKLQVENAHRRICDFVERKVHFRICDLVRRGIVEERPSHTELGVQAADIAAALASREYELGNDVEYRGRAFAVKQVFARVCLNGQWV